MKYHAQYPCRCRKCEARQTLPKHPDNYIRPRRCWRCGHTGWRVDRWRRMTEHRRYACDCKGIEGIYDFKGAPHRRKSLWCIHGKATEEQIRGRFPQLFICSH